MREGNIAGVNEKFRGMIRNLHAVQIVEPCEPVLKDGAFSMHCTPQDS